MNRPALPATQQGAALAIALLMLVIITLLGVAAVRATQVAYLYNSSSTACLSSSSLRSYEPRTRLLGNRRGMRDKLVARFTEQGLGG